MNRNQENGFQVTQLVEEPSEQVASPPPGRNGNTP